MIRTTFLLGLALAVPSTASATWSIIAVDRSTGRVVIASATCVNRNGEFLKDVQAVVVLAPLLVTLAFATSVPVGADQSVATLTPGSMLPRIDAETLSAKKTVLPEATMGKIGFLVFSFSRGASDPARCWTGAFGRSGIASGDAATYGIMMLAEVPRLLRGVVGAGIKSGMPAETHDRILKLTTDDEAWRTRLGVQSTASPYVVLVDRSGRVRWLYAGACDATGEQRLREQVMAVVAEKHDE